MIKRILNFEDYFVNLETGQIFNSKGKELKASKVHNGYLTVTIANKRRKVHRLVLSTAEGIMYTNLQVNHKDGNKENNAVSNLEWCTPLENTQHAERNHLRTHIQTKVRKDRRLSDEEVLKIRELINNGYLYYRDIVNIVPNATPKNIYAIKHNLSYKAVHANTEVN